MPKYKMSKIPTKIQTGIQTASASISKSLLAMSHLIILHECALDACADIAQGFARLQWLHTHHPLLSPYLSHGRRANTERSASLYFLASLPGHSLTSAFPPPLSPPSASLLHLLRSVALQILCALKILHSNLFCHGALRPRHVRVLQRYHAEDGHFGQVGSGGGNEVRWEVGREAEPTVRIVGYGMKDLLHDGAVVGGGEEEGKREDLLMFTPPEAVGFPQAGASPQADIWALGAILCEVVGKGKAFFGEGKGRRERYREMVEEERRREGGVSANMVPLEHGLDPCLADFIKRCLFIDPNDRDTASALLQHAFVTTAVAEQKAWYQEEKLLWSEYGSYRLNGSDGVKNGSDGLKNGSDGLKHGSDGLDGSAEQKLEARPNDLFTFLCTGGDRILTDFFPDSLTELFSLAQIEALPSTVTLEDTQGAADEDPWRHTDTARSVHVVVHLAELQAALEADEKKSADEEEGTARIEDQAEAVTAGIDEGDGEEDGDEDGKAENVAQDASNRAASMAGSDPASYIAALLLRSSSTRQKPPPAESKPTSSRESTSKPANKGISSSKSTSTASSNPFETRPNTVAASTPKSPPLSETTTASAALRDQLFTLLTAAQRAALTGQEGGKCREAFAAYFDAMGQVFPSSLRPLLWSTCLGIRPRPCDLRSAMCAFNGGVLMSSVADEVVWRLAEEKCESVEDAELDKQLQVDVPRCHSYHPLMQSRRLQIGLARIVKAWSGLDKEHVYMQGLDSVAACVLCLFPHDLALSFAVFRAFEERTLKRMFRRGNEVHLGAEVKILWQLLAFHDPKLWQHLDEVGITLDEERTARGEAAFPHFVIPWVLTFFAHTFPVEQVWRVWDLFLITDADQHLHFPALFGVSVLVAMRTPILKLNGMEQILKLVKDLPLSINDLVSEAIRLQQAALKLTPLSRIRIDHPSGETQRKRKDDDVEEDGQSGHSQCCVPSIDCIKLGAKELRRLLFVDLRPNEEYKKQRIRGSINVTLEGITSGAVVGAIVQCRKDRHKQIIALLPGAEPEDTAVAARALVNQGCAFVSRVDGELRDVLATLEKEFVITSDEIKPSSSSSPTALHPIAT